jgi:hypothetical protein
VLLSDTDREQLFELLSRHAAAGRLALDELERRVVQVAEAKTRAEAAAVLADLPPLAASGQRPESRRVRRGHGDSDRPAPDWMPTPEQFRDPRSGRIMRVWIDTGGGRHYVSEA